MRHSRCALSFLLVVVTSSFCFVGLGVCRPWLGEQVLSDEALAFAEASDAAAADSEARQLNNIEFFVQEPQPKLRDDNSKASSKSESSSSSSTSSPSPSSSSSSDADEEKQQQQKPAASRSIAGVSYAHPPPPPPPAPSHSYPAKAAPYVVPSTSYSSMPSRAPYPSNLLPLPPPPPPPQMYLQRIVPLGSGKVSQYGNDKYNRKTLISYYEAAGRPYNELLRPYGSYEPQIVNPIHRHKSNYGGRYEADEVLYEAPLKEEVSEENYFDEEQEGKSKKKSKNKNKTTSEKDVLLEAEGEVRDEKKEVDEKATVSVEVEKEPSGAVKKKTSLSVEKDKNEEQADATAKLIVGDTTSSSSSSSSAEDDPESVKNNEFHADDHLEHFEEHPVEQNLESTEMSGDDGARANDESIVEEAADVSKKIAANIGDKVLS